MLLHKGTVFLAAVRNNWFYWRQYLAGKLFTWMVPFSSPNMSPEDTDSS
jgi:hypothetical protein